MKNFVDLSVPVVLGSDASSVSMAMQPSALQAGILLFSPISSAVDLRGKPMFLRTCPADDAQAVDMARWLFENGIKRAGILYVANTWGDGLASAFRNAYPKLGGQIVAEESVESDKVVEYRTQLLNLRKAGAEAIFSPTYPNGAGLVVKQAREMKWDVPLYGADCWQDPQLVSIAGKYAEGASFICPGFDEIGPKGAAFVQKYRAKYGQDPNFNAASSYDAMNILAEAVEKVLAANETLTGTNIRIALLGLTHSGVTGETRYGQDSEPVGKLFNRMRIEQGKATRIPVTATLTK